MMWTGTAWRYVGLPMLAAAAFVLAVASSAEAQDERRVLFVGNSYTAYNGLAGLVEQMMTEQAAEAATTGAVTPGGYRLDQHARDASGAAGETSLRRALVTNDPTWGAVVLQDQSQVGGFPMSDPTWQASRDGAVALATLAGELPAYTVLYQTWGRRTGDDRNPAFYPDFSTMQDRLRDGYAAYADAIAAAGEPVSVAPVGDAFARIHAAVGAEGDDPATTGTLFWRLYAGDGSHPSNLGSHLAAYTLFAALTGKDPRGSAVTPRGEDPEDVARLQQAAFDVVLRSPLRTAQRFTSPAELPSGATWTLDASDQVRPWVRLSGAMVVADVVRSAPGAAMVVVDGGASLDVGAVALPGGGVHVEGDAAALVTAEVDGDVFVRLGTWDARAETMATVSGRLEVDESGTLLIGAGGLQVEGAATLLGVVELDDPETAIEAAVITLGGRMTADGRWSVRALDNGRQALVFDAGMGTPDTGAPDTGTPDTGAPDTGAPDTGAPDTGAPDTGAPDAEAPDSAASPDTQPPAERVDSGATGTPGGRDDRVDLGAFGGSSSSEGGGCASSGPRPSGGSGWVVFGLAWLGYRRLTPCVARSH